MSRYGLLLLSCAASLVLIWLLPEIGVTSVATWLLLVVAVSCPLLHAILVVRRSHTDRVDRSEGPPTSRPTLPHAREARGTTT